MRRWPALSGSVCMHALYRLGRSFDIDGPHTCTYTLNKLCTRRRRHEESTRHRARGPRPCSPPTAGAGATAAPTAKPKANIVQTASPPGQFKTLVALVKKAGLVGALSGKGPLTVFAPTDAAFAKVPKATLTALGKDKAKLKAVLLYHVVVGQGDGRARSSSSSSAKTLNGASRSRIKVTGGKVYVNGARVVTPDVAASNGVIHVINKVLIPPT